MNESKHTPLPWKVTPTSFIASEHDGYILLVTPFREDANRDKFGGAVEEAVANARLIVKAVNSHDELLRACRHILARLDLEAEEKGQTAVFLGNTLRSELHSAIAKAEVRP